MDLKAIAALVAVTDHGSFSLAAEQLGCSKAYLSKQIKALESKYKTQLLLRTTRKMSLTPTGERFVNQCHSALSQIQQAEDELLLGQETLNGKIRIAAIGGIFGEQYLAPALFEFMKAYPDISVDLSFSSEQVDLLSGDYDVAIRFGDLPDSSLVIRKLTEYRPILVANADYIKQFGSPKHPDELSKHRLIMGSVRRWTFQQQQKQIKIEPNAYLHCGNGEVMLQAAIQGLGIANLPSMYVASAIDEGLLEVVLPTWQDEIKACNIIYPPSRFRLKRVQVLVEWLMQSITV
mgnify:CR=1 FL=1|tara:strand:- start:280 stop:1152 length:873 start_codon:yes stop_codon:yes gene_type:complete